MNIFSKFYCRCYQITMRCFLPFFPYREPEHLSSNLDILRVLEENSFDNVMIVTDKGVLNAGVTKGLETCLKENGVSYSIFSETNENPTIKNVEDAFLIYNKNECQCIIAIGGGSAIDCAKALGARLAKPNKTLNEMKGLLKVNRNLPLLFAIPTTAGTGSEVTVSTVIIDSETKHKFPINDFDLIPHYVLLDAKLTLSLPKNITATTGMDALTHAIEAFIGRSTTKSTRLNSLTAIKLIFDNLEKAYEDGSNLQARKRLLRASNKAGLAFSKSYVGYVHAVAHTLGGEYNIGHGFANAVILPYMLKVYGKSVYKKLFKIAKFTGLCDEKTPKEVASKLVIEKIENMNKNMGIPTKIKGIKEEDIEMLSKKAADEANPLYPVPKLMNEKQLRTIYYLIRED